MVGPHGKDLCTISHAQIDWAMSPPRDAKVLMNLHPPKKKQNSTGCWCCSFLPALFASVNFNCSNGDNSRRRQMKVPAWAPPPPAAAPVFWPVIICSVCSFSRDWGSSNQLWLSGGSCMTGLWCSLLPLSVLSLLKSTPISHLHSHLPKRLRRPTSVELILLLSWKRKQPTTKFWYPLWFF